MLKTFVLGLIVFVLILYIVLNKNENFDNNSDIAELKSEVFRINNRLGTLENLANNINVMKDNFRNFNINVMNAAVNEVRRNLMDQNRTLSKTIDKVLKKVDKLVNDFKNLDKRFTNDLKNLDKRETDRYNSEDTKVNQIDNQLHLLIKALDAIKEKELSDFKKIQGQLISIQKNKLKVNKNMVYLMLGIGGVVLILVLLMIFSNKK